MRSAVRSKNLSPATTPTEPVPDSPGPLSNDLSPAKREAKTKRGPRGDLSPAETPTESQSPSPGVLATDHRSRDHQPTPVGGVLDGDQIDTNARDHRVPVDLDSGQVLPDAHRNGAAVDLDGGQNRDDTRVRNASVDLDRGQDIGDVQTAPAPVSLPPAIDHASSVGQPPGADLNGDHHASGTQEGAVADASEGNGRPARESRCSTADPSDALLLILADRLNDVEGLRKATANQLSALTRSSEIAGGKGLSEHSKAAVSMADWLVLLEQEEHKVVLQLQRALRQHPLGGWVKDTVGIGEKQGARLVAAIGDPYWNHAEDRPRRGPAELWAYCGYAPEQKRRKGVQSNWNAEAKMRAFLCAESCIKQTGGGDAEPEATSGAATRRRSPYRDVYDQARANWADRDTSDGHKHAHALRVVSKEILKDLYLAARAIHQPKPEDLAPVSANGASESETA